MTLFPNSSAIIIHGGNFTSFQTERDDGAATQVLGKRKRQDSEHDGFRTQRSRIVDSDGLMILKAGDVELRRELVSDSDNSYRIHVASRGGRLVVIKTFEGPRAKQDWKVNVAFSKECLHPNVLQIVGISDESSKRHFIQFHGIKSEQKMQWLIANALGTDLNTSVQLSMKAAGLSHIKSQKIPVMYSGMMNNSQKWDNFDILAGNDDEPIIAFHLSSTICEDGSVSQNSDIKTDSRGMEVLNGLCDQLFSGARSILYDDSPKREFDVYDSEDFLAATLEHEESTSNLSESEVISNRSSSMENPKPTRKPRREVWWLDLGATNHSLKSIGRCFEDRLNWSLLSSSNSLLRRIRSPKDDNQRRDLHQCPGYLREEITLTCDLSKSVIVSHAFPGLSERCSICHQLVQYTCSESFDNFAPVGGIDPVNSSDASSVMGELFQPSPPSNEDIQSMQSMTDLNIYQDLDTGEPGSESMSKTLSTRESLGKFGPQTEHVSHDWDRVERGAKARRREFDYDYSMSSISFATVDSDPGPSRIRNRPSLFGLNRVTSKSSLRTSFNDFSPSACSSDSYSLEDQLADDFGTQTSVSSHIPGSVSPPQLQLSSLSPTMSPPLSPSSPWLQVQHHKEDLLSRTVISIPFSFSPSSTSDDPSHSPLDLNAQAAQLPLPPPSPPSPYAYGYGPRPYGPHHYTWDSTNGLVLDDSIQPAPPLPPLPPSLETHLLSPNLNTLPPFSELEAVAGGEYNALSR